MVNRLNMNDLAQRIAKKEGRKRNLSIAQVKEVIALVIEELQAHPLQAMLEIMSPRKK